ncbi:hypothetical protein GKZ68_10260 [Hymenobacter sp. BRD128]|uniref:hypothetical protein n=1 Tax=Hymenobacter sp. BRD128 TaxID=2675878 RepID=UPI0015656F7E|nr:hypothetical protein [Hymenobacter sp. BRD128]QKG56973.1 hypothetical protein GKZ68_10260 [Hymenobacter sp. BRD128]
MTKPLRYLSFLLLPALLQACSHGSTYSGDTSGAGTYTASVERPKTPEELRAELLTAEQAAPADYLGVAGTYHRNFISQLVLEGDIASKATLATYKDPVLTVTWYSKTQTEIGTQQYPVYELLRPQGAAHFKLKTDAPGEVASVAMSISGATPVE